MPAFFVGFFIRIPPAGGISYYIKNAYPVGRQDRRVSIIFYKSMLLPLFLLCVLRFASFFQQLPSFD